MSNRFSALNEETNKTNDNKKTNNKKKESQSNIFRNSKEDLRQSRDKSRREKQNQFRNSQNKSKVKKEFKVNSEEFPTLENKSINTENLSETDKKPELTYSEKIIKQKMIQQEAITNKKWLVLTRESLARLPKKETNRGEQEEEVNEYYRKNAANLIMETRRQYREELNDILGDMSPYWDLPTEFDDDDEEEEDEEEYSEEEESEYVDENW